MVVKKGPRHRKIDSACLPIWRCQNRAVVRKKSWKIFFVWEQSRARFRERQLLVLSSCHNPTRLRPLHLAVLCRRPVALAAESHNLLPTTLSLDRPRDLDFPADSWPEWMRFVGRPRNSLKNVLETVMQRLEDWRRSMRACLFLLGRGVPRGFRSWRPGGGGRRGMGLPVRRQDPQELERQPRVLARRGRRDHRAKRPRATWSKATRSSSGKGARPRAISSSTADFKLIGGNSGIQYRSFEIPGQRLGRRRLPGRHGRRRQYTGIIYGEKFRGMLLAPAASKSVIEPKPQGRRSSAQVGDPQGDRLSTSSTKIGTRTTSPAAAFTWSSGSTAS